MVTVFKTRFIGSSTSVASWFRVEVIKTIKEMRLAILLMIGLLAGAWVLGLRLADVYMIPSEWFVMNENGLNVSQITDLMGLVSGENIIYIWFHNIRAMLLGSILGIFSFGVAGILILLFPIGLIAYFMQPLSVVGIPAWKYLVGLVLPHGIVEVPVIILLGASLLRVGAKFASPSRGEPISDEFLQSLADWAKIMIGLVIPVLLLAALMEVLVTPRVAVWLFAQ